MDLHCFSIFVISPADRAQSVRFYTLLTILNFTEFTEAVNANSDGCLWSVHQTEPVNHLWLWSPFDVIWSSSQLNILDHDMTDKPSCQVRRSYVLNVIAEYNHQSDHDQKLIEASRIVNTVLSCAECLRRKLQPVALCQDPRADNSRRVRLRRRNALQLTSTWHVRYCTRFRHEYRAKER